MKNNIFSEQDISSFLDNLAVVITNDESLRELVLHDAGVDVAEFNSESDAFLRERSRAHLREAAKRARLTLNILKEKLSETFLISPIDTSGLVAHFRKYCVSSENSLESLILDYNVLNAWRSFGKDPIKPVRSPQSIFSRLGITDPRDIDLEGIAYEYNVLVEDKPLGAVEGRLVRNGERGLISVNSRISDKKKKRFIIAHELAHFLLHKHVSSVSSCNEIAKFNVGDGLESDANNFAADFLMPPELIRKYSKGFNISCDLLSDLADSFEVSLSAMALQFSRTSGRPLSVVFSQGSRIVWYHIAPSFPLRSLKKLKSVPAKSKAGLFFETGERTLEPRCIKSKRWFEDASMSNRLLWEDCFFMPNIDASLTLIWDDGIQNVQETLF